MPEPSTRFADDGNLKEFAQAAKSKYATKDLGITGASVGQAAIVASVDTNGVPTSWQSWTPQTVNLILTVSCVTTDSTTVTGQTVTVREKSASGRVIGTAAYSGTPVTFSLPEGFDYFVEVTDALRMHGAPSTASGKLTEAKTVTLTYASLNSVLKKDSGTGRYTNASLAEWMRRQRDGKTYGVSIPKGNTTTLTKTGDNVSVANPTPGTIGTPAVDAYVNLGPFIHYDVNGGCDADGTPFVTAIKGIDSNYAVDGSNGDVWSLTPVRYRQFDATGSDVTFQISDTPKDGFVPNIHAELPSGELRSYMLYAKYAGVKGADGYMHSYSGMKMWTRNVSHNSTITQCRTATTGYSGKSVDDDQYLKDMIMLKYASKNSQSVFAGCTNYNLQYSPVIAETGVKRVILTNAQAANLVVGSAMMLGTHTGTSTDRNTSYNYDVFDGLKIASIETYDSDHKVINFDSEDTFDVETTYLLSTAPWHTGSCDQVDGDGSPYNCLSGKEPFVLQGIEVMLGAYEVLGDVIVNSDGSTGWELCVNHDTRDEATSLTSDYVRTGKNLPSTDVDGWNYPLYPDEADGLMFGTGTGGSTTVGMCDGTYTNKTSTSGTREFLGFGGLGGGSYCGLWYVSASNGLSYADGGIGGRLSATGRSKHA